MCKPQCTGLNKKKICWESQGSGVVKCEENKKAWWIKTSKILTVNPPHTENRAKTRYLIWCWPAEFCGTLQHCLASQNMGRICLLIVVGFEVLPVILCEISGCKGFTIIWICEPPIHILKS